MSSKPKFFLLDAGPIIELHRLGLWSAVLDRAHIFVPRVVAEAEAEYWVREDDSRRPINAVADGEADRLTILDCDQAELRRNRWKGGLRTAAAERLRASAWHNSVRCLFLGARAIGLTDDRRFLVSQHLPDNHGLEEWLIRFAGQPLRGPS